MAGISTGAALLISSAVAAGASVYSAKVGEEAQEEATAAAAARQAEELELKKQLASKVTAGTKEKGDVQLKSSEALADEEIKSRAKRSRLKVARTQTTGTNVSRGGAVGTGLKVG